MTQNNQDNQKEFKKFDRIVKLDFSKILKEKKSIFEPNVKMTQKAYDKICEIWNKDEKSRKFLKHIISAFFPINNWNKVMFKKDTDIIKCAILNHDLTGISNISESLAGYSMKKMFIDANCILEGDVINNEKKSRLYKKEELDELNSLRNSLPISIREGDFAYMCEKSDKFISGETAIALQQFIELLILNGDKEMTNMIRKMRNESMKDEWNNDLDTELKITAHDFEQKRQKEQKQIAKEILESKAPKLSDNLNTSTLSKLEELKLKMQENE